MFKKHKRLVIAIVLGAIVLCIGGKIGMDYKKDYDWQQEKNRQLAVAKKIKENYKDISSVEFKHKGVRMGSGAISYDVRLNDSKIDYNGLSYFSAGDINVGGAYDPKEGILEYGKTTEAIKIYLSNGEEVNE